MVSYANLGGVKMAAIGALFFLIIGSVLAFAVIMGIGWAFGAFGNKPVFRKDDD